MTVDLRPSLDTGAGGSQTSEPTVRPEEYTVSDLFDQAKNLLEENADKIEGAVDKLAEVVDEKTGGKHKDRIDKGADQAKNAIKGFVKKDQQQ